MWSAAASTGEEPYSMAMTVLDAIGEHPVDFKILATDISTRVLQRCLMGEYPAASVEKIPMHLRSRFMEKRGDRLSPTYTVSDELRKLLCVKRLNLSVAPFPMRGPLDVVFCRNVMIYFDKQVRIRLLNEIYRLLKPGGYLMVGHSESLMGLQTAFKPVCASVYTK